MKHCTVPAPDDRLVTVAAQSGIATRLRAGQQKDPGSIPGTLLFSKLSIPSLGHIQAPFKRITRAVGGKAEGYESDHSPPSNTEIINEWSYSSITS